MSDKQIPEKWKSKLTESLHKVSTVEELVSIYEQKLVRSKIVFRRRRKNGTYYKMPKGDKRRSKTHRRDMSRDYYKWAIGFMKGDE